MENGSFKCRSCDNSFTKHNDLQKHTILCSKKDFRCRVCGKEFNAAKQLIEHLRDHIKKEKIEEQPVKNIKGENVPDKDKKFQCNLCAKEFNFERNMRENMND